MTQAYLSSFGQLLGQAQIPFGGQEPLHQGAGWRPEDGMTRQDEFIPKCGEHVTFPDARLPNGNDIDRLLQERSWFESLDLELQRGGEPLEIERAEGFLQTASPKRARAVLCVVPVGWASSCLASSCR